MTNPNEPGSSLRGIERQFFRFSGYQCGLLAGGVLLWSHTILAIVYTILIARFTSPLSYPEGAVVDAVWRIASSEPLYLDWRSWPHVFTPYGPLLYYPSALMIKMTDLVTPGFHYFQFGRLQSMICLGLIGLVTTLIARRAGSGLLTATTCTMGFLSLWPRLLEHTVSFRPDAPMVLFNMTAVWIAMGGFKSRIHNFMIIICLWLAVGFKPQGLAAPLVIGMMACHEIGWKKTLAWFSIYLTGVLAAIAVLDQATDGLFMLNTWHALPVGLQWPNLFREALAENGLMLNADLVFRPVFMLIIGICFWKFSGPGMIIPQRIMKGVGCYCVLSTLICTCQLFKIGSDVNYLLEPFALTGVVVAMLVMILSDYISKRMGNTLKVLMGVFVFLLAWLLVGSKIIQMSGTGRLSDERIARKGLIRFVANVNQRPYRGKLLSHLPPPVLLMDHAYTHPEREAHSLNDPYYYAVMVNRNMLNTTDLVDRIRSRKFDIIAMSAIGEDALFNTMKDKSVRESMLGNYDSRPDGGYPTLWHRKPAEADPVK